MPAQPDIKEELINLLTPIFGEAVKRILTEHYESSNPQEIVEVAHHLLVGYMGEKNADRLIGNVLKKYPNLKIAIKVEA